MNAPLAAMQSECAPNSSASGLQASRPVTAWERIKGTWELEMTPREEAALER